MSISTRTGDLGTTGLMYNHRVSKCHPRVEACGSIDELNAALGWARATASHRFVQDNLLAVQKDLIVLMGDLATLPEDSDRYAKDGFSRLTPEMTAKLDALVREIESQRIANQGWATPGASVPAAALDVARVTCRRAERRVCALFDAGQLRDQTGIVYLNRLSDALWLLARWVESRTSEARSGDEPAAAEARTGTRAAS